MIELITSSALRDYQPILCSRKNGRKSIHPTKKRKKNPLYSFFELEEFLLKYRKSAPKLLIEDKLLCARFTDQTEFYSKHYIEEGAQETIISFSKEGSEPIFTIDDFKSLESHLKNLYQDPSYNKRTATLGRIKGVLREKIARNSIEQLIEEEIVAKPQESGKSKYTMLECEDGSVEIYKKTKLEAGGRPEAEVDGMTFLKDEIIVYEAKNGKVDISKGHVKNKIILPLKDMFPKKRISYGIIASYYDPCSIILHEKEHKIFITNKKERVICKEILEAGANPFFFGHTVSKEHFEELSQHIMYQYHVLKGIAYMHEEKNGTRVVRNSPKDKQFVFSITDEGIKAFKKEGEIWQYKNSFTL